MSIADPIREKGRELSTLARKLSEHLGGRDHQEWSGPEIVDMMKSLHETLGLLADHLDVDDEPEVPSAEAPADAAASAGAAALAEAPTRAGLPELPPEPPPEPPDAETVGAAVTSLSETLRRRAVELSGSRGFGSTAGAGGGGGGDGVPKNAHSSTLEEFFGRVGDSLITAQRQLDQRAQHQLSETVAGGGSPDLATLYRIPKVSAELKFALEEVGTGGINLLIYRQGTEASTLNQQTVQFEIAAVPAPPETVAAVRQQAPHLDWVFDAPTRSQIREALEVLEPDSQAATTSKGVLLGNFERVLAVRDPSHDDGFFLAFAEHDAEHRLGVWHLHLEPLALTAIYRFELRPKAGEDPTALRDVVAELGERQAALYRLL